MATAGAELGPLVPNLRSRSLGDTAATPSHVRRALFARRAMLVVSDLLYVWCGACVALALRFPPRIQSSVELHAAFLLLYSGLVILFCNTQGLYSGAFLTSKQETIAVTRAIALASTLLTAFIYIAGFKAMSRMVVI